MFPHTTTITVSSYYHIRVRIGQGIWAAKRDCASGWCFRQSLQVHRPQSSQQEHDDTAPLYSRSKQPAAAAAAAAAYSKAAAAAAALCVHERSMYVCVLSLCVSVHVFVCWQPVLLRTSAASACGVKLLAYLAGLKLLVVLAAISAHHLQRTAAASYLDTR